MSPHHTAAGPSCLYFYIIPPQISPNTDVRRRREAFHTRHWVDSVSSNQQMQSCILNDLLNTDLSWIHYTRPTCSVKCVLWSDLLCKNLYQKEYFLPLFLVSKVWLKSQEKSYFFHYLLICCLAGQRSLASRGGIRPGCCSFLINIPNSAGNRSF